jgi:hypothetical protein
MLERKRGSRFDTKMSLDSDQRHDAGAPEVATMAAATTETLSDDGIVRVIKARVPIGSAGRKLIRLSITRL